MTKTFGLHEDVQAAAWLHDTVGDTPITIEQISLLFGPCISMLVEAVTDEPGENRCERAGKTLPKIRRAGPDAVALKLCDRIANVISARANAEIDRPGFLDMYSKEQKRFRECLYRDKEFDRIWNELERLLAGGNFA